MHSNFLCSQCTQCAGCTMYCTNASFGAPYFLGEGPNARYFAGQTGGKRGSPPHFSSLGDFFKDGDLEKVLAAVREGDNPAAAQTGRTGREGPRNGPCFVYAPVVNGEAGSHRLDPKKTRKSSPGWTKEELSQELTKVPEEKIWPGFDYAPFAGTPEAQRSASKG